MLFGKFMKFSLQVKCSFKKGTQDCEGNLATMILKL